MNSYFISGSHSTGKTTILNDLIRKHQYENCCIKVESEIARDIVKEWNIKQQDLSNEEIFEKLQIKVLKRQCQIHEKNRKAGISYIADRGIDPLVYAKWKLSPDRYQSVLKSKYAIQFLEILKSSMTFVIYPHKECIVDDGIRYVPIWEDLLEYHKILIDLLTEFKIPFYEIKKLDRDYRANFIMTHILKDFKSKNDINILN